MNSLFGMKIIENPLLDLPQQRMTVSPEFRRLQSPDLVAETNRWMLEFFGTHRPVYVIGGSTVVMGREHMAMLRRAGAVSPILTAWPK